MQCGIHDKTQREKHKITMQVPGRELHAFGKIASRVLLGPGKYGTMRHQVMIYPELLIFTRTSRSQVIKAVRPAAVPPKMQIYLQEQSQAGPECISKLNEQVAQTLSSWLHPHSSLCMVVWRTSMIS